MEATALGRRRKTNTARRRFLPSSVGGLRLQSQGAATRQAFKGGIWLAEIIFQSKLDAIRFHHYLQKCLNMNGDFEHILLIEDRHIVKIMDDRLAVDFLGKVKNAFFEFITQVKLDDWFRGILQNRFFYEDADEQQQILEILHSVLAGQREDLSVFLKKTNEEPAIRDAINHIFQKNVSFSFDSFLKFRLRPYLQLLESYVEISIDEYRMEQEYQMFVHMLRVFLADREPKMDVLHILFDDEITFFDRHFSEIKRGELTRMIDRKLLVNHPIYVDSVSIAPLLSIAPNTIFIYTKNPDEPLVRTIKNIFEERVAIKSHRSLLQIKKHIKEQISSEYQG